MSVISQRTTAWACANLQFSLSWEPEGPTVITKPISALAAGRLSHILWPSAMGLSTWVFARELFKQNLHSTATFFGFDLKPRDSVVSSTNNRAASVPYRSGPGAASGKSQPLAKSSPEARGANDQDALASSDTQAANGPESTSEASTLSPKSAPPSSSSTTSPNASGPDAEAARSTKANDIYGVQQVSEHIRGPKEAMMKTFTRNFRPARPFPPRGSVYFIGFVQLVNSDARVTFEVLAFWDPAEKKWWPQMDIRLKPAHTKAKSQSPSR